MYRPSLRLSPRLAPRSKALVKCHRTMPFALFVPIRADTYADKFPPQRPFQQSVIVQPPTVVVRSTRELTTKYLTHDKQVHGALRTPLSALIGINRAILCRQEPCPHSDDSSRDELIFWGSYADNAIPDICFEKQFEASPSPHQYRARLWKP